MRSEFMVPEAEPPDCALVRRAQRGEESAFRAIVERYQNQVFSMVFGIVRNPQTAEEIAQQVFAELYLSLRRFDCRPSLAAFLYKAAIDDSFDQLDGRASGAETATDEDCRAKLLALISRLPKDERRLLMLTDVGGFSIKNLARLLDTPEEKLVSRLFQARRGLVELARRASVFQRLARHCHFPAEISSRP